MHRWDSYDAYLFDLDGTLLNCKDAVHYFAFCHALHLLSGQALDLRGVVAHGNTDGGILRDALTVAGVDPLKWRPLLPAAVAAMEQFVQDKEGEMVVERLTGADDVLKHLKNKGAVLAVATGNLASIGKTKMRLAGVVGYFTIHGFSDGLESRDDVFRRALDKMREAHPNAASVCVVGDTPRDVQAAHANGLDAIAVAGGVFSVAELAEHNPEYCVNSLNDLMKTIDQPSI